MSKDNPIPYKRAPQPAQLDQKAKGNHLLHLPKSVAQHSDGEWFEKESVYLKHNFPVPQLAPTLGPALLHARRPLPALPELGRPAALAAPRQQRNARLAPYHRCSNSWSHQREEGLMARRHSGTLGRLTAGSGAGTNRGQSQPLAKAAWLNTPRAGHQRRSPSHCWVSKEPPGATGYKGVSKCTWSRGFPALLAAHREGKGEIPQEHPASPCTHQAVPLPLTPYCRLLPLAWLAIIKRLTEFEAGKKNPKPTNPTNPTPLR